MPPGGLPARAGERTDTFVSDKQPRMVTVLPGLKAGTGEQAHPGPHDPQLEARQWRRRGQGLWKG